MTHKNLTLSGNGESEYIGYKDQRRIVAALVLSAEDLLRQSRSHKWTGENFRDIRAELRREAKALQDLASRIGYPEE